MLNSEGAYICHNYICSEICYLVCLSIDVKYINKITIIKTHNSRKSYTKGKGYIMQINEITEILFHIFSLQSNRSYIKSLLNSFCSREKK